MIIAHTKNAQGQRQDLLDHLRNVADAAARFAMPFEGDKAAYLAGLLHDIGKFNPDFQQYLLDAEAHPTAHQRGPDHKGAGATLANDTGLAPLSFLVAGHHGGLPSADELKEWLRERAGDPAVQGATAAALVQLPGLQNLKARAATLFPTYLRSELEVEFFIRMLFSTLVDSDFLDTEQHFNIRQAGQRGAYAQLTDLEPLLLANQQALMKAAEEGKSAHERVNALRNEVYEACLNMAVSTPGFFRLTVPTGGGKTRSSLAFALRHANTHHLRRIIYAIPYTSITEQTADTFRSIFGAQNVLEHHSAVTPQDLDRPTLQEIRARLATENWDAPLIVTTTVQLFESLLGRGTSACRKLHNVADSVLILDEVQTLPTYLLIPILDVLRQLVAHYHVSVVLCTATQPALDAGAQTGFSGLEGIREIAPEPARLFTELKRVEYRWSKEGETWTWEQVADHVRSEQQALAIVNTRANAVALLNALDDPEALHLSTWMCGAHRRKVLALVRQRLQIGVPCRLISTQVIEAGVDVDFPLVLRAMGPLDSIVQAAGRCNRNGLLPTLGQVIVFQPDEGKLPPGSYRIATDVAYTMLGAEGFNFHDPTIYHRFFESYYDKIDGDAKAIQPLRKGLDFREVASRFRMIDDDTLPAVIVDYEDQGKKPAKPLVEQLIKQPSRGHLRALQPYIVTLRSRDMRKAVQRGTAEEVKEMPGFYLWRGRYDPVRGVDPEGYLDAGGLII